MLDAPAHKHRAVAVELAHRGVASALTISKHVHDSADGRGQRRSCGVVKLKTGKNRRPLGQHSKQASVVDHRLSHVVDAVPHADAAQGGMRHHVRIVGYKDRMGWRTSTPCHAEFSG